MGKDRKHYLYTALFCEENIWHLAQKLSVEGFERKNMTVLLLTNPLQQIVLFNQSCRAEDEAVIWDYHVILLLEQDNQQWIYDFDSRLDFPTNKKTYFCSCFPEPNFLQPQHQMFIRYIPATSYLHRFSSDRSHMKNVISSDLFPAYPPIFAETINNSITLENYCDMSLSLNDDSWVEPYSKP